MCFWVAEWLVEADKRGAVKSKVIELSFLITIV